MLVLISGVSGAGKTTLIRQVLKKHKDYAYLPSYTTRKKRAGEVDGNPYYFVSEEEFEKEQQKGMFLEWCEVHKGIFYGTHKKVYETYAQRYPVLITDIDVVGMQALKGQKELDCVTVFITVENEQQLRERLIKRGEKQIEQRLARASFEIEHMHLYDYVIVNTKIDVAGKELEEIIKKELQRRK